MSNDGTSAVVIIIVIAVGDIEPRCVPGVCVPAARVIGARDLSAASF